MRLADPGADRSRASRGLRLGRRPRVSAQLYCFGDADRRLSGERPEGPRGQGRAPRCYARGRTRGREDLPGSYATSQARPFLLTFDQPTLSADDFAAAQVDFVPLSLRDVKLQKSDIVWADIGGRLRPFLAALVPPFILLLGLAETKRVLRETLEWPTKYGPIFAQSPLRLRSG